MKQIIAGILFLLSAFTLKAQSLDIYGGDSLHPCVGTLPTGGAIPGATGFFYTYKDTNLNHWMYCDPLGNRFWQTAVQVVDYGGDGYTAVVTAKYGVLGSATGWEATQVTRLKAMGFNTLGQGARVNAMYPKGNNPNPMPFEYQTTPSLYASVGTKDIYTNLPPKWDSFGGYRGYRSFDLWDPVWTSLTTGVGGNLCTASLCDCMSIFGISCATLDASPWLLDSGMGDVAYVAQFYTNQSTYAVGIAPPYEQFEFSYGFNRKQVFSTPTMYIKQQWANWLCGTRYANLAALNAAWGSTYTTCGSSATTAAPETIGTGDGVTLTFTTTLLHLPVDPASIGISVAGVLKGGDTPRFNPNVCTKAVNNGCIQGIAGSNFDPVAANSNINYTTGVITVAFSVAPANGAAITATYQYNGWPKSMMATQSYTQLATDNFTGPNANPIGGNWTTQPSSNAVQLLSNRATPVVFGCCSVAYYNAISWPNDQYSEVTIAALTNTSYSANATVRASTSTNSHYDCTVLGVIGGTVNIRIDRLLAGVFNSLISGTATVNTGDVIRCEIVGTILTYKLNGVIVLTSSDGNLSSGSAAIGFNAPANGATLSNWAGGSITVNQVGGNGVLDEDGTSSWWPVGNPASLVDFPDPPITTIQSDMDVFLGLTVTQYVKPIHDWFKSNLPHHLVTSIDQAGAGVRDQVYNSIAANADTLLYSNGLFGDYSIIMSTTGWQTPTLRQYNSVPKPVYVGIYATATPDSQFKGMSCPYVSVLCFQTQATKGQFYQQMANVAWNNIKGSDGYGFMIGLDYWQYVDNNAEHGAYGLVSLSDNLYGYPPACPLKREDTNSSITDCYGFTTTAETNNYGNFVNSGVICGNYVWLGIPCNNTALSVSSPGHLP